MHVADRRMVPNLELNKAVVRISPVMRVARDRRDSIQVGPDQRRDGTHDQKQRVVSKEVPDAVHNCPLFDKVHFVRDTASYPLGQSLPNSKFLAVYCVNHAITCQIIPAIMAPIIAKLK